jgi:hypothetical protein
VFSFITPPSSRKSVGLDTAADYRASTLDQHAAEDALSGTAERNGLVGEDGPRQCWATIRSGLSKGLFSRSHFEREC